MTGVGGGGVGKAHSDVPLRGWGRPTTLSAVGCPPQGLGEAEWAKPTPMSPPYKNFILAPFLTSKSIINRTKIPELTNRRMSV